MTTFADDEPVCPSCSAPSYREKVVGHTDRRRCTTCCHAFDAPLPPHLRTSGRRGKDAKIRTPRP